MSWVEDHFDEFVDSIAWRRPSRFACRNCGEGGLTWVEVRVGVWRPAKGSRVHECKRVPQSAAADVADLA